MAKKTDADLLMKWFNHSVVGIFKQHHAFEPEGIFIGDASYLFVPDNDKYEGSSRMLFDEHNHPVDSQKVSPKQRAGCTWRCCCKMISLIHTNRKGAFFLYGGVVVTAGKDHECPIRVYRWSEYRPLQAGVGNRCGDPSTQGHGYISGRGRSGKGGEAGI